MEKAKRASFMFDAFQSDFNFNVKRVGAISIFYHSYIFFAMHINEIKGIFFCCVSNEWMAWNVCRWITWMFSFLVVFVSFPFRILTNVIAISAPFKLLSAIVLEFFKSFLENLMAGELLIIYGFWILLKWNYFGTDDF